MGTAGLLNATVKFDPDPDTPVPGGDGGDAGGPAPIIGGFYVHSLSTDAQFVYADYGKAKIDKQQLKGEYKTNDIFFLAFNVNWKF